MYIPITGVCNLCKTIFLPFLKCNTSEYYSFFDESIETNWGGGVQPSDSFSLLEYVPRNCLKIVEILAPFLHAFDPFSCFWKGKNN